MTTTFTSPKDLLAAAGTQLGPTDWITITQDQINNFADATLDNQWIHVDTGAPRPDRSARRSPTGT